MSFWDDAWSTTKDVGGYAMTGMTGGTVGKGGVVWDPFKPGGLGNSLSGPTAAEKGYGMGSPGFSSYNTGPGLRTGDGMQRRRKSMMSQNSGANRPYGGSSKSPQQPWQPGGNTSVGVGKPLGGTNLNVQNWGGMPQQSGQAGGQAPQQPGQNGPTQAPQGWDQTRAGVGEQWWNAAQGGYAAPSNQERYLGGAMQALGNYQGVANNAQGAYNQFQRSAPENLAPYYENAKRRTAESLGTNMASRGSYGSSAMNDQIGEAFTNLEAERANREGQYGLSRAGMAGNLAQGADSTSRMASQDALGWLNSGQNWAQGADAGLYGRLNGGMGAATTAEQLRRQRGRDYFNDTFQMGNTMMGLTQDTYNSMMQNDASALDASMLMGTGLAREALNQGYRTQERHKADGEWGANMFGSVMGGMTGMGG
jgi:hypothetical protein